LYMDMVKIVPVIKERKTTVHLPRGAETSPNIQSNEQAVK